MSRAINDAVIFCKRLNQQWCLDLPWNKFLTVTWTVCGGQVGQYDVLLYWSTHDRQHPESGQRSVRFNDRTHRQSVRDFLHSVDRKPSQSLFILQASPVCVLSQRGVFVCRSVTRLSSAKTAEPVKCHLTADSRGPKELRIIRAPPGESDWTIRVRRWCGLSLH